MPDDVLLDALARQALAMREMADGLLHTITAIKRGRQEDPEEASVRNKVKTFEGEVQKP